MVEIRNFELSDISPIDEIFKLDPRYGVPDLTNMLTNATIENSGRVIGYGAVKLFAETYLKLDPRLRKREKAEALKKILQMAILRSKDAGLEKLFAISENNSFSDILRNKYGFRAVPGELLVLELHSEEKDG